MSAMSRASVGEHDGRTGKEVTSAVVKVTTRVSETTGSVSSVPNVGAIVSDSCHSNGSASAIVRS